MWNKQEILDVLSFTKSGGKFFNENFIFIFFKNCLLRIILNIVFMILYKIKKKDKERFNNNLHEYYYKKLLWKFKMSVINSSSLLLNSIFRCGFEGVKNEV